MSFLIFGAIYCFFGGCLLVCFFSHSASYNFLVGYSFSLGPSCHWISWNHSLFGLLVKIIRLGSSNLNYLSKKKNCGVILMGVFPHLKVLRLCLIKWEIHDARVMTWLLSSVESHLVLNLMPYKTAATMWTYLNTVYNQDNSAKRFHLEYEMTNFTQGSLSIEEYFSGFQTLWVDYCDIVYANVFAAALSAVREVHATSKRDQFLMKLRPNFEITHSNLMNRHPVPSRDACLSELLCEEQRIVTQATMEHRATVSAPVYVAYVA